MSRFRLLLHNVLQFVVPVFLSITVVGFAALSMIEGEIDHRLTDAVSQNLTQNMEIVERVFETPASIATNFEVSPSYMQELKQLLVAQPWTSDTSQNTFIQMLRTAQYNNPYIYNICIYVDNPYGNYVTGEGYLQSGTEEFQKLQNAPIGADSRIVSQVLDEGKYGQAGVDCISILAELQTKSFSNNTLGTVIANYRTDMIVQKLRQSLPSEDGIFFLVSQENQVLCGTSAVDDYIWNDLTIGAEEMQIVSNGREKTVVFSYQSQSLPFSLVYMVPYDTFYIPLLEVRTVTFLIMGVCLILGVYSAYAISRRNVKSLILATSILEKDGCEVSPSDFQRRNHNTYDYILQNVLYEYVQEKKKHEQYINNQYNLKAMELKLLQSQINPHFLHNTLQTIFWKTISLTNGENDASKMIEYLSDILRYVFGVSDNMVSLSQEITYAQSYIKIQKIRYNGNLTVQWDYDEDLLDVEILRLLLQPILENCIYHGMSSKLQRNFKMKISIWQKQETVHVLISDNGMGMQPQQLQDLKARLAKDDDTLQHIGVVNVKKRLFLSYEKDEADFRIRSKYNFGTSVHMEFPKRHKTTGLVLSEERNTL